VASASEVEGEEGSEKRLFLRERKGGGLFSILISPVSKPHFGGRGGEESVGEGGGREQKSHVWGGERETSITPGRKAQQKA